MNEGIADNTDRELYREPSDTEGLDNYYSPSLFVTKQGAIGINVGGYVHVKTLRSWHKLAEEGMQVPMPPQQPDPSLSEPMTFDEWYQRTCIISAPPMRSIRKEAWDARDPEIKALRGDLENIKVEHTEVFFENQRLEKDLVEAKAAIQGERDLRLKAEVALSALVKGIANSPLSGNGWLSPDLVKDVEKALAGIMVYLHDNDELGEEYLTPGAKYHYELARGVLAKLRAARGEN